MRLPRKVPVGRNSRSHRAALAAAFAFLLVASLLPATVHAGKRVRVDWDNYQPPGTANRGNVTAGTLERLKRIYTDYLNSLQFVTSNNNSVDIVVYVTSGLIEDGLFGDAHAIGNTSADVYGGMINSAAGQRGTTNESDMVNALGRTIGHELGHDLGLRHTSNTSDLMCDGQYLENTQRFDTTHEGIPGFQRTQLNSLFAMNSTAAPRA